MKKLSRKPILLLKLLLAGVKVRYPSAVFVKGKIRIGSGTVIRPNVYLDNVEIGKDCTIGPSVHITDSVIGDGVEIGFTAQVKRSTIGDGCRMHHHGYIGDAELGRNVNVGAGAITCNFDGRKKHRTIIGNGVFIGSNVNLIAPIKVAPGCLIAAGSTLPAGQYNEPERLIVCRSKDVKVMLKKKK